MISIGEAALALGAAGGLGWFGNVLVQWVKSRGETHATDRTIDAQLEQHWTETMLELVGTLRDELAEAKKELSSLRPMEARLAHFEEALDHIHNLLSADTDLERRASERRAAAFMRRMRGESQRGEQRQTLQTEISARRVKADTAKGKHDDD